MKSIEKIAVIDIGSNSCRMVIYEKQGAAILPYFNEKTMAGLGRDLPVTGHLSIEGKAKALDTFRRFGAILSTLDIDKVFPVATSAVREASDGKAFADLAALALDAPLRILSGADEGRLSAVGVGLGFAKPNGLVVDLGGSSLELQSISPDGVIGEGETYLLGPLARSEDAELSLSKRRKIIMRMLVGSPILPKLKGDIYAVGGAWRNVAAVHMELTDYPLRVIHGYKMNRRALKLVLNAISGKNGDKQQDQLKRIAKRRYETLAHATLVLDCLLELGGKDDLRISAYGLREGVLAELDVGQETTPILDTANLYLRLTPDSRAFGEQLAVFLKPLFPYLNHRNRILELACLMADAGARMHPDHRSQLVFQNILRAPLPGLNHQERLFLAMAAASRYTFKFKIPRALMGLCDDNLVEEARIFGTAMRLAGVYSGRSAQILRTASVNITPETLSLRVLSRNSDMISGTVKRRLKQLAGLLERDVEIERV